MTPLQVQDETSLEWRICWPGWSWVGFVLQKNLHEWLITSTKASPLWSGEFAGPVGRSMFELDLNLNSNIFFSSCVQDETRLVGHSLSWIWILTLQLSPSNSTSTRWNLLWMDYLLARLVGHSLRWIWIWILTLSSLNDWLFAVVQVQDETSLEWRICWPGWSWVGFVLQKIFTNDSLQVQKLHLFGVEDLLARLVGPCVATLLRVVLQASHQGWSFHWSVLCS